MPVYEFQCKTCEKRFELQQHVDEHAKSKPPPCPWCGSTQVESVMSPFFSRTTRKS